MKKILSITGTLAMLALSSGTIYAQNACSTVSSLLGSASDGAVIGLAGTKIQNSLVKINGDEYVSQGGSLVNMAPSVITGNVFEYSDGEYSGPGKLDGTIMVNPGLLDTVNADAITASAAVASMAPTQTFGAITTPTVVNGDGGINVIDINGNIKSSLTLSGGPTDVFFVNVSGTITLVGSTTLAVSGGVTPASVLYNLTGSGTVSTHVGNVLNGTILAPGYSFNLDGVFNGSIIGGGAGKSIGLLSGAKVYQQSCSSSGQD